MNKINKKILFILSLILCVMTLAFSACAPQEQESEEPLGGETGGSKQTLILSKEQITLEKLESMLLTVDGVEAGVVWKSTREDIATVNNGEVSAISAGVTVIIAEHDGKEGRCTVVVEDHKKIPNIETNVVDNQLFLMAGDVFDIVSNLTYNNKLISEAQPQIK